MTDYSLNETAGYARLAAKGAGYSWGMAEEVSRAIFWLARRALPGPEMLLQLLSSYESTEAVNAAIPTIEDNRFSATGSWLCPIASGCAMSDFYNVLDAGTSITLLEVKGPILMLPFIADIAKRSAEVFVVEMDGMKLTTNGDQIHFSSSDIWTHSQAESVVCRTASHADDELNVTDQVTLSDRVLVDDNVWKGLGDVAHRTYVPASESSRAGAGAGLSDND